MALDRNAKYIYQAEDFTLTLLVGTSISENTYYLNDDSFIGDFVVKGNYKTDLPSGYPLASTAELNIFTDTFIGGFSELARWIKANSAGVDKVPNCWIFEQRGYKTYFAQVPREVEEDDFAENTYKIQLISTDKWAFERSEFANIRVSESKERWSWELRDMKYSENDDFQVYTSLKTTSQLFKMAKLNDIWESINAEVSGYCDKIHRGLYTYTLSHTINDALTLFYPNTIEGGVIGARISGDVYMCYEVRDVDENLIGGYRKWLMTKYKNVWNFITAYAEGLGLRYYKNVSTGGGLNAQYLHQRINRIPVSTEDFESKMKGSYGYNVYSQINNRKNLNYCKFDGGITFNRILSLSLSMPTLEYNSLINNVMDSHKLRNTSNGNFYTEYELSDIANLPFNRLYFFREDAVGSALKVSHACEVKITTNPGDGVVALQGEGSLEPSLSQYSNIDAFNLYGSAYQLGIPQLANHIIRKVIADKQTWVELTLPIEKAHPNTLGMEYNLNIFDTIRQNPFYDDNRYTNIGVLVNFETNYTKGETKCKFFLRSDEWAE